MGRGGLTSRLTLLIAGGAVVIGLVLLVIVVAVVDQRDAARAARRTENVLITSSQAQAALVSVQSGPRGFVAAGGDEAFLAAWQTGRRAATTLSARLAHDADSATQRARARAIAALVRDYVRRSTAFVALARRDLAAARAQVRAGRGARGNALNRRFAAFDAVERVTLAQRSADADRNAHRAVVLGVGALIALPIFVLLFGILVTRAITRPVRRLSAAAERLGGGDLEARAAEGGGADIATLARTFNAMAEQIEQVQARNLARLDAVFSQSPVGLAIFDREGTYVRVNAMTAEINGRPADEHVGRTPVALLGDEGEELARGLERALAGETFVRARDRDGRSFDETWFPVRNDAEIVGAGKVIEETTERRRLQDAERESVRRTTRLMGLASALSTAVTEDDMLDIVIEQGAVFTSGAAIVQVPALAGTALDLVRSRGFPPALVESVARMTLADPSPSAAVATARRARYFATRAEMLRAFPAARVDTRGAGRSNAWAIVPLLAGGELMGVLTLIFDEERDFPEADRDFLAAFGDQCANALQRARLYERQRSIAATLQRSLLPEALPEIEHLSIAARYHPAGEGYEVGGDFYDAFELDDGRWLVAIGDVQGKGPEAAALTGVVRNTLRAEALHEQDATALMRLLNTAVLRAPGQRFVTAAVAVFGEPEPGRVVVDLACAGHPPPVVVTVGGPTRETGARGTALGVTATADFRAERLELTAGDALVLYTDGLLDAHAPRRFVEPDELLERLRGAAALGPGALLDRLEALAHDDDETDPPRDDIALLAVQVGGAPMLDA